MIKENKKLSKAEEKEINILKSYYSSLDLDCGSDKEYPNSERDILRALTKLISLHDEVYK